VLAFFLEHPMDLVEIEITGQAITARYGTLNTGDVLRTDPDYARHLVQDCSAAKYTTATAAKQTPPANKTKAPARQRAQVKPAALQADNTTAPTAESTGAQPGPAVAQEPSLQQPTEDSSAPDAAAADTLTTD
jgi:hypothetical protein